MSTPILKLERVSKAFGGIHALRQISFALEEGQIVALIGPNGAGKTTLVNLITGVHRASGGRIAFRGTDVTRQRPFQAARRGLARTFQIVQPFPRMSVLENVAAGALFGGGHALHFVGLEAGQDFAGEALDLRHEEVVRQRAAVHRELHGVGAGALGGFDDAFGDLVGGAERHVFGLLADAVQRQPSVALTIP